MNWIKNMNSALDYIEEHICEDITSDKVAKIAYSSKFHFLRSFYMLTGMTLGEYIRQRRLSLSASDVITGHMKIIDIAYKYGYETPEAFTKAFKKLHSVSPSKARKEGIILKAIPPLSFQITVKGEKRMDYKIIKKEAFKASGFSICVSTENGENLREIPKFWCKINENGICDKLAENAGDLGILGICYGYDNEQKSINYMAGIQGENIEGVENYEVINIPSYTWAVFESVGSMPNAIQKVWNKIYSEWFPATKYEHAGGPELEVYLPGDPNKEDYKCEVWIPVIEK